MTLIITSPCVIKRPKIMELSTDKKWFGSSFNIKNTNQFSYSKNKTYFVIANERFQKGLFLRRWESGDRICSATNKKHILLSDLFINNKLSSFDKLVQPIVVDKKDTIIWIPGLAHSNLEENIETNKLKVLEWHQA